MAKTLLEGVNKVLQRTGVTTADLTTLTDATIQRDINLTVDNWNEATQELYTITNISFPKERKTFNLTLVLDEREYDGDGNEISTDVEEIIYPGINEFNGNRVWQYPGGFEQMRKVQIIPSQWIGLPYFAALNPETGLLRLDRAPDQRTIDAQSPNITYKFPYDKRLSLTQAIDNFPFSDTVFDALVPVVTGMFRLERNAQPLNILFPTHYARACKLLPRKRNQDSYLARNR